MGLLEWWSSYKARAESNRISLALNTDENLIGEHVPELLGMSDVEGMAYVMEQIEAWNQECTKEQATMFVARLAASKDSWDNDGLLMPYWGNLWVLRNLQVEIGWDVPTVSKPVSSS